MKIIGSEKGIHSPEFHKKKTRLVRLKRALALLIAAVLIALPIYLARTQKYLISHVEVRGNEVTKSEDIESIVARDLSGNYLWILPHSNTILYPKSAIVRDLMSGEPRLSSVSISRVGAKGLAVAVTERSPVAEYCKDVSEPSAPQECFFLDDTGYIFAGAPAFSGNVYLTYATIEPYDSPIGQRVLPADELAHTRELVKNLGEMGIYPRVFLIKNDEYHLILSNGAEILWEKSSDPSTILASLTSFLSDKSIASDQHFLSRVAYIDMRFGNKVFYKYRGE